MREILYKYNTLGAYTTEDSTAFAGESELKLIVEPHDFSIKIGNEILRKTSFEGCTIIVSNEGEVVIYDTDDSIALHTEKTEKCFKEIRFIWEEDSIRVQFGHTHYVDHYPNCDGEHDRWSETWVSEYEVSLLTPDHRN
ncbi:MAG: hypothetical protein IJ298_06350 [Ruminococcus sp.]|nr:hypothetical protein [Ruminococcus sp.]